MEGLIPSYPVGLGMNVRLGKRFQDLVGGEIFLKTHQSGKSKFMANGYPMEVSHSGLGLGVGGTILSPSIRGMRAFAGVGVMYGWERNHLHFCMNNAVLDVKESGFCPVFNCGVNVWENEFLEVGVKYEYASWKTETKSHSFGLTLSHKI